LIPVGAEFSIVEVTLDYYSSYYLRLFPNNYTYTGTTYLSVYHPRHAQVALSDKT